MNLHISAVTFSQLRGKQGSEAEKGVLACTERPPQGADAVIDPVAVLDGDRSVTPSCEHCAHLWAAATLPA